MRKARGRAVFADGLRPLRPLDEEENLGVYVAKVKRADAPVAGHEVTFHWYVLFTFAFQTLAAPPQLMVNGFGVATAWSRDSQSYLRFTRGSNAIFRPGDRITAPRLCSAASVVSHASK